MRGAPIIAIDGPAGSGKSTAARNLAAALGFVYIDTGAMYRAATWLALEEGIDLRDEAALVKLTEKIDIRLTTEDGAQRVFVGGVEVTDKIRSERISRQVYHIAGSAECRKGIVAAQREMAACGGVVAEGRDIGTVVFPDAEMKFFLVAGAEERARRRRAQLLEAGEKAGIDVTKGLYELPKSLNPADVLILSLLQSHFNVRVILMSGHRKTPVDIIGAPEDVDFALYALTFLRETFFRCWNEFKKTTWNPDRASYYRGLRDGIEAELTAAKAKAEQSYAEDDRNTYALAVVDRDAAITRYVDENYGKVRTRRQRRRRVDSTSYFAGETKGRTIRINRPLTDSES